MNEKRPFMITFVTFLTWINGLLNVILGMLLTFSEDFKSGPMMLPFAILSIVVGVLTILFASGLLHGNPRARLLITFLLFGAIVAAVSHILISGNTLLADLATIILSLVVLGLLWLVSTK